MFESVDVTLTEEECYMSSQVYRHRYQKCYHSVQCLYNLTALMLSVVKHFNMILNL
jgi:hypothetical protein